MSLVLVAAMYAVWSSVFSLGKMALAYSPPIFLTGLRMSLAGVLLFGYMLLVKRSELRLKSKQWLSLAVLGFFSVYLSNILEFWGLQHLSAAKTCFIYSLSPFFAAFFSYLHFRETMNKQKWIGLGIGFIGFIPVLLTQTGSEELFHLVTFLSWPTLSVMGAALFASYGWILLRVQVKNTSISPLVANGSSMLFGGTLALTHSFFIDAWNPVPIEGGHTTDLLKNILLLTAVSNILCYNLYGFLLKRYTATLLSFMGLLSPIFASLNGSLFLQEPISWTIFLSTAIVCVGLGIVHYAELKQGYIVKNNKKEATEPVE